MEPYYEGDSLTTPRGKHTGTSFAYKFRAPECLTFGGVEAWLLEWSELGAALAENA